MSKSFRNYFQWPLEWSIVRTALWCRILLSYIFVGTTIYKYVIFRNCFTFPSVYPTCVLMSMWLIVTVNNVLHDTFNDLLTWQKKNSWRCWIKYRKANFLAQSPVQRTNDQRGFSYTQPSFRTKLSGVLPLYQDDKLCLKRELVHFWWITR